MWLSLAKGGGSQSTLVKAYDITIIKNKILNYYYNSIMAFLRHSSEGLLRKRAYKVEKIGKFDCKKIKYGLPYCESDRIRPIINLTANMK
jgi:hypothetical protein